MEEVELIEIELGFDRIEAEVIAARCRTDGLRVELRLMDNGGQAPGLLALQAHRLIAHRDDRVEVQAIDDDSRSAIEPPVNPLRVRRPVLYVLSVAIGGFMVWTMLDGFARAFT